MTKTLLIALALLQIGCSRSKQIAISDIRTVDSSHGSHQLSVKDSSATSVFIHEKDTVYVVKEIRVADTLSPEQAAPAHTSSGSRVPRYYFKQEGNITAWVSLQADGSIAYGCQADSLQLLIKGLYRQLDIRDRIIQELQRDSSRQVSNNKETLQSVTVRAKSWLASNWLWMLGAIIALLSIRKFRILDSLKDKS